MSKGEEKISKILTHSGISYEREKTFNDLKNGKYRFDFYIPSLRGRPVVIEFNGQQHYHFVSYFCKSRKDWLKIKENDRRKISYCLAKGIIIYIIPFWDIDNINSVMDLFNNKYIAHTRWKNDEEVIHSPLYGKK